jgi:nucleotide-binding universal stress UspA family protein
MRIERVLVATDFSDSATHALAYGISFARQYSAEILLLHVVESFAVGYASDLFPVPMAEVFDEIAQQAKVELGREAVSLRDRGLNVREVLAQGKASAEIVRVAEEERADLIVLGTHGKGMLDHALFGSTAERVIRKAPCPVLSCRLHPKDEPEPTP